MESKTFKIDIKEKSRETLINNEVFDTVIVKNFWDAHGEEIAWEDDEGKTSHTYTNAKVLFEKVTQVYFGTNEFTFYKLTINGKKYPGEIASCKGNKAKLVLTACLGAG